MRIIRALVLLLAISCHSAFCQPVIDAVVSSSDLRTPALGAGSLATVFCRGFSNFPQLVVGTGNPLPTTLAGVTVIVNGIRAPILAVATDASGIQQVNFQIPWEIASSFTLSDLPIPLSVSVVFGDSSAMRNQLEAKRAGEFFWIGNRPAIFHADFSLVTNDNPAKWGETLIAYATGLTITSPRVSTGFAAPGVEPLARVVDQGYGLQLWQRFIYSPTVLYQGLAPGLVGVFQINFILHNRHNANDLLSGDAELQIVRACDNFRCPPRTAIFSERVPFRIAPAN